MADFKNRLTTSSHDRRTVPHRFPRRDTGRRPAPLRPSSHQAISAYPAADPDRLSPLRRQPARPRQSCLPCSRPIPSPIHPREAFSSTLALLPTLQTRTSATLNQPHPTTATRLEPIPDSTKSELPTLNTLDLDASAGRSLLNPSFQKVRTPTTPSHCESLSLGKSRRRTAYPQQIVTTRLLYCLQDRFAQLSRLQRI